MCMCVWVGGWVYVFVGVGVGVFRICVCVACVLHLVFLCTPACVCLYVHTVHLYVHSRSILYTKSV